MSCMCVNDDFAKVTTAYMLQREIYVQTVKYDVRRNVRRPRPRLDPRADQGAEIQIGRRDGRCAATSNKLTLTHGEYEAEATWLTRNRKFTPFVMQRIFVAIQIAAASEIRQALGMSLALSAA